MDDFLKKVQKETAVIPPVACLESLNRNFESAIRVEWEEIRKDERYEAIFYREGIEYIARFDLDGTLLKYKMYLPNDLLPAMIREDLESKFEIMNVVLINEGNQLLYEIIVRDKELTRRVVLTDTLGRIQEERPL